MSRPRECEISGCPDPAVGRVEIVNDDAFERALCAGDTDALTAEILRRLDDCIYGTGIVFRCDRDRPAAWRGTTRGSGSEHHPAMAREASVALIAMMAGR